MLKILLAVFFAVILSTSTVFAVEPRVNVKGVTNTQTNSPIQVTHLNGTILWSVNNQGQLTNGIVPKTKISTSGTFSESDIPTLSKSKISTSGTWTTDEIPALTQNHITGLVTALSDKYSSSNRQTNIVNSEISASANIDKSKISVTGAWEVSEIPTLPQSKITSLTTDLAGKQDLDSDLTTIGGLSATNDDIIQKKSGAWTNRSPAQFKSDLSLSKSDVGLSNVDNTSDANKPVSTATQTALDAKESISNKGQIHGYASLNSVGKLNSELMNVTSSGITKLNGQTGSTQVIQFDSILNGTVDTSTNATLKIKLGQQVATTNLAQTLTSKTINADSNIITNIDNNEIKVSAGIDASKIGGGGVSTTEFDYLGSVTSDIQAQINGKASTSHGHSQSDVTNLTNDLNSKFSQASHLSGGSASLLYSNSSSKAIFKKIGDSTYITWSGNTTGIITPSLSDIPISKVTSLQSTLDAKYSASNRQTNIVNSEIDASANISKSKISTIGTWVEADLPTISKSKISSTGTWSSSEIPSLDTSKITTGTFDNARVGFKIDNLSNTCSSTDKISGIVYNNSTGDWTVTCSTDQTGVGGGFTKVNNVGSGTIKLVQTNSSNTANIKSLSSGQGITLTNGTTSGTIATNFKIDTQSATNDFQIIGFDNSTGDFTRNQFSVNTQTCSGNDKISAINNVTGQVTCSADQTGSGGSTAWAKSAVRKTADYIATTSDGTIIVDSYGGNRTITLPLASDSSGQLINIFRNDTGPSRNWVMVKTTSPDSIDNSNNWNLTQNKQALKIQSNGTKWFGLNKDESNNGDFPIIPTKGTGYNRWWLPQHISNTALTTLTAQTAAIQAYPFVLPVTTTFDRGEIDVSALLAGSTCRIGIYTSDHRGYPFKLVSGTDVGTISTAATGRVGSTFTTPITLDAGLYYTAVQCSTAATLTLRANPVAAQADILGFGSGTAPTTSAGFSLTRAYGAFPTNYGTPTSYLGAVSQHAVFLRAIG